MFIKVHSPMVDGGTREKILNSECISEIISTKQYNANSIITMNTAVFVAEDGGDVSYVYHRVVETVQELWEMLCPTA